MTVNELYSHFCALIPASLSAEWDSDGLQVCRDGGKAVSRVLLALDLTSDTADRAAAAGCDVIITHHPLLFRPLASLRGDDGRQVLAVRLYNAGISSMSFHTRFDILNGGVSDILAEKLGLSDVSHFGADGEDYGRIGSLPMPLSAHALAENTKKALAAPFVSLSDTGRTVCRVAAAGGAGKELIAPAVLAGADAFITGSVGYNELCAAREYGISIIEAGHYYTEAPALSFFEKELERLSLPFELYSSDRVEII